MMASARLAAAAGGLLGTAAMTAASALRTRGIMPELRQLSGSVVAPPRSGASQIAGAAFQYVHSGALAQLYLSGFRKRHGGADWRSGLAFGLLHGAIVGVLFQGLPAVHPKMPGRVAPPGPFMINHGAGAAAELLALHGLFGAVIGLVCSRCDLSS